MPLTQETLRALLSYDPQTGEFRWLMDRSCHKAGIVAGSINSNGYITIGLFGKTYQAHRLAWLYVTGEWPKILVDHIDGKRSNNAFANLREANYSQNNQNSRDRADNTSGHRGVKWSKELSVWIAEIYHNRRAIQIGRFTDKDEAILARQRVEIGLHSHSRLHSADKTARIEGRL